MLGIKNIGVYIPKNIISNVGAVYNDEGLDSRFLEEKIGVIRKAVMPKGMDTSDLCENAFGDLLGKERFNIDEIDCICVCTETPDYQLPSVAAIVHNKLKLPKECAFFDISVGCSGYVYGLKIMLGFMNAIGAKKGILFTADPYSKIIDKNDKNTNLLFGDAATATLISTDYCYGIGNAVFSSATDMYDSLIKRDKASLFMDGRRIYNFALKHVPLVVKQCLAVNGNPIINLSVFHQASKYVVEAIARKVKSVLPADANAFWDMDGMGNTVSSSIPILLNKYLFKNRPDKVLICGFGVGLSVAALILNRSEKFD